MKLICIRGQESTLSAGAVVEMVEGEEMVYWAASGILWPIFGVRLKVASSLSENQSSEHLSQHRSMEFSSLKIACPFRVRRLES